jgi:hypothetical protein
MMYSATSSSFRGRWKRNEKGDRRMSGTRATGSDCIVAVVKAPASVSRCAERVVEGRDDAGRDERVVVWIERRPDALWAVGRAVNQHLRPSSEPRPDDYVWQGYELDDALAAANETLEDDCSVSEEDGSVQRVRPFRREELLARLEQVFFGR